MHGLPPGFLNEKKREEKKLERTKLLSTQRSHTGDIKITVLFIDRYFRSVWTIDQYEFIPSSAKKKKKIYVRSISAVF